VARVAHVCFNHRRAILALWLAALIGFSTIGGSVGARYNNSFSLPAADSTAALNLLKKDFPARAGDSEQVVIQAKHGTLRSSSVAAAVTAMLTHVARLAHVRSVTSPYTSAGQISSDGTIGFATVNLDAPAQNVPKAAVTRLIATAKAAASSRLVVQLGGQAIENNDQTGGSAGLLVGAMLALVVLFFAFGRSLLGALLPIISALAGIGVATAIVDILTHAMAVASWEPQVATLVALGVGVDYALLIVTRHRSSLIAGRTPEEAAILAIDTSGRSVLLAGLTVCVALLGMFALQVSFLYGVAVSVTLAVAFTMLASLTLLPALLGFFGTGVLRRADRERLPNPVASAPGFWARWAQAVGRRPATVGVLALALVLLLAVPFFSLHQGLPDASTDPASSTTHQAYRLLTKGFGPGFSGPLELVGQISSPSDTARFARFVSSLQHQRGVARIQPPRLSPNGRADVAVLYPTTGPQQPQTTELLHRIRLAVTSAEAGSTLKIHVGGATAINADFSALLAAKMPQFVAVVIGLGFVLLALVLRSLLIPLLASIMNLLSFGAALGAMTATFQYGWGQHLLGFGQSGPIVSYLPVMMFAILFGLSMDYEVFLVTRIHEEWTLAHDNRHAVTRGQTETGRVITTAAVIMILVFTSFILAGQFAYKQIGLGFAVAIFVDAFIIRTALVPAAMHALGNANWWMPDWLDRRLPRLHTEPPALDGPARPLAVARVGRSD
jgi:RND superfamily putative drug exporter